MPNLHLDTGSQTIDFWQAQEDRDEREGEVDVSPSATYDSDEAYLSGMTEAHSQETTGIVTGNRLSRQTGYSNDPVTALAEWVQTVMALINGQQGQGYTLTHDVRDLERNVVLESFGWTRSSGEKLQLEWDLAYRIGEGVMVDNTTSTNPASPSSTWTLDGRDLQHPIQYREEKRQKLGTDKMLNASSAEQNTITSESGAVRTITISAEHTGTVSERKAFDDHMKLLIGQDTIATYQSAFPGHELDVMVNKYESVLEAGRTRVGEYSLELIEGTTET